MRNANRPMRYMPTILAFGVAGWGLQAHTTERLQDVLEWEFSNAGAASTPALLRRGSQARTEPDPECDPSLRIWWRFCNECVSTRPMAECSDAASR